MQKVRSRLPLLSACAILSVLSTTDACAVEFAGEASTETAVAPASRTPWWRWPRATGSWGGTREKWMADGVIVDGYYTHDHSSLLSGNDRGRSLSRGLLQLGVGLDLEQLAGWKGSSFFAGLHSFHGRNGSDVLGDIQGYSNIDADRFDEIAEVWFEQRTHRGRLRLKLGRVDANTEFAFVGAGGEFVNSSAGFSPTILFLPTYPSPAPSVNLFYSPSPMLHLGVGLYDRPFEATGSGDDPRALFTIGQVTLLGHGSGVLGPRRLVLGAWHDSGRLIAFDGSVTRGTNGLFAVAEQRLLLSRRGTGLDLFLQYGRADEDLGEFATHWSLGLLALSPLPRRAGDGVGLMISAVDLSDAASAGFGRNETTIELFYGIALTPFLRLKPDLQYVMHPSGESGRSLVGTIRFEIAF